MPFQNPSAFAAPNPQGTFGVTPLGAVTLVANTPQALDQLIAPFLRGIQGDIQSVWVDASLAPDAVVLRSQSVRQYAVWPGGHFGWQPLLLQMPTRIEINSTSAATVNLAVATSVVPPGIFNAGIIKSSAGPFVRSDAAASLVSQQLIAANIRRQGVTIFNESAATLYALLGDGTASPTNYSAQIAPMSYFETPYEFGGAIQGVWSAATGGARITEIG